MSGSLAINSAVGCIIASNRKKCLLDRHGRCLRACRSCCSTNSEHTSCPYPVPILRQRSVALGTACKPSQGEVFAHSFGVSGSLMLQSTIYGSDHLKEP